MTILYDRTIKCANCGAVNTIYEIGSTNAFGTPDLDGRPPDMQRSTMHLWVQQCEKCGIAGPDISWIDEELLDYFRGEEFRSKHDSENFRNGADKFWTAYLLALKDGEIQDALAYIRYTAWECDDMDDVAAAKRAREIFLDLVKESGGNPKMIAPEDHGAAQLIYADFSRRAGRFDDALNAATKVAKGRKKLFKTIAGIIIDLCDKKDTGCYNIKGEKTI